MYDYSKTHRGFYVAGNKRFTNKLDAIIELNSFGGNHDVHWDYHEDVYNTVNWTVEPKDSLLSLYGQRAKQIRDNYDHVILLYSGGADSQTILEAFIHNNIPFDEVIVFGAFEAERNVISNLGASQTPGYYTREYHQIAKPILKELQKTHKFKITEWDWADDILDTVTNNHDWAWDVGARFAPDAIPRQYLHEKFRHTDRFDERGKTTAFVYGVDKPRLLRDDNFIYATFIDALITTGVGNTADIHGRVWENDEFFYWSANFPEIVVKQAHVIARNLADTNRLHLLPRTDNLSSFHHPGYYGIINNIIYPNWDNRWQIKKPTSAVKDEFAQWFFDFAPSKAIEGWKGGIIDVARSVGTKWFNNDSPDGGIISSYSKFYPICPIPKT